MWEEWISASGHAPVAIKWIASEFVQMMCPRHQKVSNWKRCWWPCRPSMCRRASRGVHQASMQIEWKIICSITCLSAISCLHLSRSELFPCPLLALLCSALISLLHLYSPHPFASGYGNGNGNESESCMQCETLYAILHHCPYLQLAGNTLDFLLNGLLPVHKYEVYVVAAGEKGQSLPSNTLTIITPEPVIGICHRVSDFPYYPLSYW